MQALINGFFKAVAAADTSDGRTSRVLSSEARYLRGAGSSPPLADSSLRRPRRNEVHRFVDAPHFSCAATTLVAIGHRMKETRWVDRSVLRRCVRRLVETAPDQPAVDCDGRITTRRELERNAQQTGAIWACARGRSSRSHFPEETLRLIEEYRVQWGNLVPTMLHRIWRLQEEARTSFDLLSLELVISSRAPCAEWLMRAWVDWIGLDPMYESYGGTERIGARRSRDETGSSGQALSAGRLAMAGKRSATWASSMKTAFSISSTGEWT